MMKNYKPYRFVQLLAPRYWLLWLVLSIFWLLTQLPYAWQVKMGRHLGRFFVRFNTRMRHVAITNLKLCFPELTDAARKELLEKNFESAGISIFETLLAWWAPAKKLQKLMHVTGEEHFKAALKKGRGVIICTAHFTSLELAGRLFGITSPLALMYNPIKNPLIEWINRRALNKHYQKAIPRHNVREMLRCLKDNMAICYTADVDAGVKNSLFVPFFKIPAASLTATSRFASMSNASVIPGFFYRRKDNSGYDIIFEPLLQNFPSENLENDLLRINQIIETAIDRCPEQYMWQYKRFKTRPAKEKDFYSIQK